jgi:hypothetical protein
LTALYFIIQKESLTSLKNNIKKERKKKAIYLFIEKMKKRKRRMEKERTRRSRHSLSEI